MGLLKSNFRGVIHLMASDDTLPEVEFDGGEGPEQILDQVQAFSVPWIKKAVDPAGPALLWEELDLERGRVRRHRTLLSDRLEFALAGDDRGIEVLLPHDPTCGPGGPVGRVWVPLEPHAEPGRGQCSALGWSAQAPRFSWRYVKIGSTPTIEMAWTCEGLYHGWAEEIVRREAFLECRMSDGRREDLYRLSPNVNGSLAYRGHVPLSMDSSLPASRRFALKQPLVLAGDRERQNPELDEDLAATVEAVDFRALVNGRPTRMVSLDDLPRLFSVEVLTRDGILLPDEIPAGLIPGLPWKVKVQPMNGTNGTNGHGANGHGSNGHGANGHGANGHHLAIDQRWTLTARPGVGEGYWGQVEWEGFPPRLRFGLGAFDSEQAPKIERIRNRRATVGWRVESDDDELLSFALPHWVPMGNPSEQVAVPCGDDDGFAREVRAGVDGLEERFAIEPDSELSSNRIYLGPRRWRFYDEETGELEGAEALGEVRGYVRWRRPEGGTNEPRPTDWAGGSAPVLLVRPGEQSVHWGGLYVPERIPWQALEEVAPKLIADGDDTALLLAPRAGELEGEGSSAPIWLSLWGFLSRYDQHRVRFGGREAGEVTAWIAQRPLELFPRRNEAGGRGFLLRSFAPFFAVRDAEPGVLSLENATPRPVLRLGRELGEPDGLGAIDIGESTWMRYQIVAPGEVPASFGPGRVPGTRLHLPLEPGRRSVVWLAFEREADAATSAARRGGLLVSWDPEAGWLFRGFFAHNYAAVELGMIRLGELRMRVYLGHQALAGRAFRLSADAEGYRWSVSTPAQITHAVTPEMLLEWERGYFATARRPEPLRGHAMRLVRQPADEGEWIFEFIEKSGVFDRAHLPGIRAWEPHDAASEAMLAGVRKLGETADLPPDEPLLPQTRPAATPPAEASPAEAPAPLNGAGESTARRILLADDDEDF